MCACGSRVTAQPLFVTAGQTGKFVEAIPMVDAMFEAQVAVISSDCNQKFIILTLTKKLN